MFRSEDVMTSLICDVADQNPEIVAVILNGSRANLNAVKDRYQDFDIIYVVKELGPFVADKAWLGQFGERLIMQEPDAMGAALPKHIQKYTYLMQFLDGNRIDLTLMSIEYYKKSHKDSLSIILLDKDQAFSDLPPANEADYLPEPPTQKSFFECCNEFYWVSTYVAKGLARNQVLYAKTMMEVHVRPELVRLLVWYAGALTEYKVNIGASGKFLEQYLDKSIWHDLLVTYSDGSIDATWAALLTMCDLFDSIASKLSLEFGLEYDSDESNAVVKYLNSVRFSEMK